MRYLLLNTLISLFLLSCSVEQEKKAEALNSKIEDIPSSPQTAGLLPGRIEKDVTLKKMRPLPQEVKSVAVIDSLKRMPLSKMFMSNMPFTENKGQLEKWYGIKLDRIGSINYYSQAFGGTAYFGESGIGIGFYINQLNDKHAGINNSKRSKKTTPSMFFYIDHEGRNLNATMEGWNRRETTVNYLKGEPQDHITGVANYDGVVYKELYKNIDLRYSLVDEALVYDYIVKPGGNVSDIRRTFDGVQKVAINSIGELEVHTK